MATIYLKSSDGKTVVSLNNRKSQPQIPTWLIEKGYVQIGKAEFNKIKRRIIGSFGSVGRAKSRAEFEQAVEAMDAGG